MIDPLVPCTETKHADPRRLTTARSRQFAIGSLLAAGLLLAGCTDDDSVDETSAPTTAIDPNNEIDIAVDEVPAPFGASCDAVPVDGAGSFAAMVDEPAASAIADNPLLSTLAGALQDADLVDTLNAAGPFTIFAPTDAAFGAADPELLTAIIADPELLTGVLTYHVIPENLDASELGGENWVTVWGEEVSLTFDGTTVNGVDVICADIPVANGTIHMIDEVLLPPVALKALVAVGEDNVVEATP